jgi:hypothetical protein
MPNAPGPPEQPAKTISKANTTAARILGPCAETVPAVHHSRRLSLTGDKPIEVLFPGLFPQT